MRFYFDTEFNENGTTIELISIGIVREDGLGYYAVSNEFSESDCNPWVQENVLTKLPPPSFRRPKFHIRDQVTAFLGEAPELWAYCSASDFVVLYQLHGSFMDKPPTWPKYCMELRMLMKQYGVTKEMLPVLDESVKHNALDDAYWNMRSHYQMMGWTPCPVLRTPEWMAL